MRSFPAPRRSTVIEAIEPETFYRYRWNRGRGTRVPGSATTVYRVIVLAEGPEEQTLVHVRRKTRALAIAATKELLGLSGEQWDKMLERYRARCERIKELRREARTV